MFGTYWDYTEISECTQVFKSYVNRIGLSVSPLVFPQLTSLSQISVFTQVSYFHHCWSETEPIRNPCPLPSRWTWEWMLIGSIPITEESRCNVGGLVVSFAKPATRWSGGLWLHHRRAPRTQTSNQPFLPQRGHFQMLLNDTWASESSPRPSSSSPYSSSSSSSAESQPLECEPEQEQRRVSARDRCATSSECESGTVQAARCLPSLSKEQDRGRSYMTAAAPAPGAKISWG